MRLSLESNFSRYYSNFVSWINHSSRDTLLDHLESSKSDLLPPSGDLISDCTLGKICSPSLRSCCSRDSPFSADFVVFLATICCCDLWPSSIARLNIACVSILLLSRIFCHDSHPEWLPTITNFLVNFFVPSRFLIRGSFLMGVSHLLPSLTRLLASGCPLTAREDSLENWIDLCWKSLSSPLLRFAESHLHFLCYGYLNIWITGFKSQVRGFPYL